MNRKIILALFFCLSNAILFAQEGDKIEAQGVINSPQAQPTDAEYKRKIKWKRLRNAILFPINVGPNIAVNTGGAVLAPPILWLKNLKKKDSEKHKHIGFPLRHIIAAPIIGVFAGIGDAVVGHAFWDTWVLDVVYGKPPNKKSLIPRVLRGEGFLSKSLFYDGSSVSRFFRGGVDTIQAGKFCNFAPGKEIAILGSFGLVIVDEKTGAWKMTVQYEQGGLLRPEIIDMDGDGDFEIINKGGGFSDIRLLDHNGKNLWVYRPPSKYNISANSFVSGDLNRDGRLEFYVIAGNGELHCIDGKGKKVWGKCTFPNEMGGCIRPSTIEIYYPEKESELPFLVATYYSYKPFKGHWCEVQFIDHKGDVIKQIKTDEESSVISVGNQKESSKFMKKIEDVVYVSDIDGKEIFHCRLDLDFTPVDRRSLLVRLDPFQKPFFAVIESYYPRRMDRTLLCIYSYDGKLVHQELLHETEGLCAMNLDSSGKEALLVGDGQKVWKYQLAN